MIRVGDRVRNLDGFEGDVLAIAGNEAAVLLGGGSGMWVHLLSHLTPIIPEPAPALLTGAQVAQVLEAVKDCLVNTSFEPHVNLNRTVEALTERAQAERERDNAG